MKKFNVSTFLLWLVWGGLVPIAVFHLLLVVVVLVYR